MTKYCVICGASLKKTNFEIYFCPNCGIIKENQNGEINLNSEKKKKPDYIG